MISTSPPEVAAPTASIQHRWQQFAEQRDGSVRGQLIEQYAPLVKYVIGRMAITLPTSLSYEDVLSYGNIGLVQSVDRFDPSVGVKFETYAIRRIRGSIQDAIRSAQPLTRETYRQAKMIDQAHEALVERLGRMPEEREIAAYLDCSVAELRTMVVNASATLVSLESAYGDGDGDEEGLPLFVQLPDQHTPAVPELVLQRELLAALRESLETLPERERLIVSLYYVEELTLREISEILKVSTSRVSQLHASALFKLRGMLNTPDE